MEENILGKGENAGYQHFLLFPKCFQKPPSSGSLIVGNMWQRVKVLVKKRLSKQQMMVQYTKIFLDQMKAYSPKPCLANSF